MAAASVTVRMNRSRDTKNTGRFDEQVNAGDDPQVGTLYVPKATLAKVGDPQAIEVTIKPA